MRLFFAIELPSAVRATLGRLRRGDDNPDYRWVDPSLMHLTLAFLGEQPSESLEILQQVGSSAASSSARGVLRLGQAGQFGSRRAPRVLWVDVTGDLDALLGLYCQLNDSLRDAGFPTEERDFRAHITLARRRETARGGAPAAWPAPVKSMSFPLDTLTLMQSRLSSRGPTYIAVDHFPIDG